MHRTTRSPSRSSIKRSCAARMSGGHPQEEAEDLVCSNSAIRARSLPISCSESHMARTTIATKSIQKAKKNGETMPSPKSTHTTPTTTSSNHLSTSMTRTLAYLALVEPRNECNGVHSADSVNFVARAFSWISVWTRLNGAVSGCSSPDLGRTVRVATTSMVLDDRCRGAYDRPTTAFLSKEESSTPRGKKADSEEIDILDTMLASPVDLLEEKGGHHTDGVGAENQEEAEDLTYTCPACGWPKLRGDPQNYPALYEICPCCGIEFGYTDRGRSMPEAWWTDEPPVEVRRKWRIDERESALRQWREKWVSEGMKWHSKVTKPPEGWNGETQLKEAGLWEQRA